METLKELELVDSNMVQTIYEYNKLSQAANIDTQKTVTKEHRSGAPDPKSIVTTDRNSKGSLWKFRIIREYKEKMFTMYCFI